MATIQLLAPQSAIATLVGFPTDNYQYVVFASNLSSTDTVIVLIALPDGSGNVAAFDVLGSIAGLTATNQSRTYIGGPTYVLAKVGTAGTAGIYAIPAGNVSR